MRKKVILATCTFLMAATAYWVFSHDDQIAEPTEQSDAAQAVRRFVSLPTTQGTQTISDSGLTFSPGDQTRVRVYDDVSGRLKYQFEAERWEPIGSDTDFHVESLLIQTFTPRGETTYISADLADVRIARKTKNRLEAQSGKLWGNVKVVIDRTTARWREEHPAFARRDDHPEALITIDMVSARFDMDRAELISTGPVVVDSEEARLEDVSDLTVRWNQKDNQVDALQFAQGGKMVIRGGTGMIDLALPGMRRKKSKQPAVANGAGGPGALKAQMSMKVPRAQANQPQSIQAITAEEAAAEIRLTGGAVAANQPKSLNVADRPVVAKNPRSRNLRTPDALATDMAEMQREARTGEKQSPSVGDVVPVASRNRIHTYRAVFNNRVVVEQLEGDRRVGLMEADKLEVNFDLDSRRRGLSNDKTQSPGQPTDAASPRPNDGARIETAGPAVEPAPPDSPSRLVLTWHGPLELRPIAMDPAQQTGERFDVIATGNPVRVQSEQGDSTCRQLVYRHERRQIWLSGDKAAPVELSVNASQKLAGQEIFFDQQRGLAHVDGPGKISGLRDAAGGLAAGETPPPEPQGIPQAPAATAEVQEPVEIQWTRGVDLEIGLQLVQRIDPDTGTLKYGEKEYLRRAWFHGDVFFKQGEEELSAGEAAVTFGAPRSDEVVADYIEHLNLVNNVRMRRENDLIEAQVLDVELALTPSGRNAPSKVHASGDVLARQLDREIRADEMDVVLGEYPGKSKTAPDGKTLIPGRPVLGIDSLDAAGKVLIQDPAHNMKVSRAESLKVALRNGNELVRATIISRTPGVLARARLEDMAIHGHRIEIDMDQQAADVPGPGKAWMVTREDFGGRKLGSPTVVKTTWTDHMKLRLSQDYGEFVGDVQSSSEGFLMNCEKLTVRFARVPPVPEKTKGGFLSRFTDIGAIRNDRAELQVSAPMSETSSRKRPTYIIAQGKAEAFSSTFAPKGPDGKPGRLLSRANVAGKQIVVDLAREQMSVPGEGTLMIEDYQFDKDASLGGGLAPRRMGGPLMSSVQGNGPSQTLVTWQNAMDLFVDRGLVAFDKDVRMVHRSGKQIVKQEELARAMNLDESALEALGEGGRKSLSCGHLLLEFRPQSSKSRNESPGESVVRATDLERLICRGTVHLKDGTMSLMGEYLQYLHDVNEVQLEGSPTLEARIIDQDEGSQRLSMWRGPKLIWNRNTGHVESVNANVRTSSH
jgi:lipopolysaccharide export system protein LptA